MKDFFTTLGATVVVVIVVVLMGIGAFAARGCTEAASVVHEEFGPRAMKDKYQWFVKQHERIEKAREDLKTFEAKTQAAKEKYAAYGDVKDWPIDVRVQYNAEAERNATDTAAMISNHDNMVRDYNAASRDFLWDKFDPEGKLPRSHDQYARK